METEDNLKSSERGTDLDENGNFLERPVDTDQTLMDSAITLSQLRDRVDIHTWPTVDELCAEENIDESKLAELVGQKVQHLAEELQEIKIANHQSEDLVFLNKLYHALKLSSNDSDEQFNELRDELSTFENFRQTLLGGATLSAQYLLLLNEWINDANRESLPTATISFSNRPLPRRFIGHSAKRKIFVEQDDLDEKWVLIHSDGEADTYAPIEVLEDQKALRGEAINPTYYHSTTSAALKGLSEHGAFLSRTELERRGQYSRSGERMDWIPKVYVSDSMNYSYLYSSVGWFDQFPVVFGLGLSKKVEALREGFSPDHGTSLGDEVPINLVEAIYVPLKQIGYTEEWAAQNCPQAKVHCLEAALN